MDKSKRKTLKAIGATSIGATVGLFAPLANSSLTTDKTASLHDQFSVHIEHTWGGLDATVVIKNTSGHPSTITGISPSFLTAEPGLFDFSVVTQAGARTLDTNEELRIPFTPMGSPAVAIGHFDRSIQKRLRSTLKIETNLMAVAKTNTTLNPHIV